MNRVRPMSRSERAALCDAIRDMRRSGIRPAEMRTIGMPANPVHKIRPIDVLAARFAPKAVRS